MALNAKISKTDFEGLSEELQGHYTEKDGSYILSVTKVDGLTLENVDGLKSTVEKLRQSEKTLTSSVKSLQDSLETEKAKFAGIDPEQARKLAGKMDEIKSWDGNTKVKEAVTAAEAKFKSQMEQIVNQNKEKISGLENELKNAHVQLQDSIVTQKITSAIVSEGGNVELLLPHVKSKVNMVKDSSGAYRPEVINSEGIPRIGDSSGSPMTIPQLIAEYKANANFAGAFTGVNKTGSGNIGGSNDTGSNSTHKKKDDKPAKVVNSNDQVGMSQNLESIAEGTTIVNMKPE